MVRKFLHLRYYCQVIFHSKKVVFFLPVLQNRKNWVSKAKLEKCLKFSKYFQCRICTTLAKKIQLNKDFWADGPHISKTYNYFYKKNA